MSIWDKVRRLTGPRENPSSPRELFLAEVEAVLADMPNVTSVNRRSEEFALDVVEDGKTQTFFLEHTFRETREMSPEERSERVRRLFSMGREPEIEWGESTESRLIPLVRPCTMFIGLGVDAGKMPLSRPFLPFLIETVAVDSDDSFQYVMQGTEKDWRVGEEAIFRAAHRNASEYFGDGGVERYDQSAPYALWHVAIDDNYETSRILVPGWLASFRGRVAGHPVAIIPQRSLLVVGGDGDPRCLERLIEMADREYAASSRNISPGLYTIGADERVVPLVLPSEHPLASEVAVGHAKLALSEYQTQKDVLQREVGDDVFVASYFAERSQDGSVSSYATWTEGVPSLLPEADEVALVYGDENDPTVLRVPWSTFHEIAGGCLTAVPDLNPPRFRTGEWPTERTLRALERLKQRAGSPK